MIFNVNICIYHFFLYFCSAKRNNRALVAKKVLPYSARAEGICSKRGREYRTY